MLGPWSWTSQPPELWDINCLSYNFCYFVLAAWADWNPSRALPSCGRVVSRAQRNSNFGKITALLCVMVTEAEMIGDSQRKEYEDSAVLLSRARSFVTCISCIPLPRHSTWLILTQSPGRKETQQEGLFWAQKDWHVCAKLLQSCLTLWLHGL